MEQRSPAPARALAAIALVCGFLVIVVVVVTSLGGGSGSETTRHPTTGNVTRSAPNRPPPPTTYVVENGDTLTSIAHRTGVSVARIEALNPGVDPQVLVSGEELKLR
jgi:LysM repeat protein